MAQFTESTVTAAGCDVHVRRGGSGAPLLYLHGASGAGGWQPFMAKLAEKFDVIVPDHPGFGASAHPDWLDNIHDLAYFYRDFLRTMKLDGVHVVGLSLGGWIAAELAVRDTSRLASLTLVASAGVMVKGLTRIDSFLMPDAERIRALFVDPKMAEDVVARSLTAENEDLNLRNKETAAKLLWQPRDHDPHLAKWLHLIDVPTLLIWGDGDRLIPPAIGEEFHRLIPGSELVVIPQCGHQPTLEKTDAFVGHVSRFIEGTAT